MRLIDEINNIEMSSKKMKEFGLFVGGIFCLIGGLLLWKSKPAYPYFIGFGGVLVILGAVAPKLLGPLYKLWMSFAMVMGFVMSHVLLGILFYFCVTPISLIAKALKNHLLDTLFPDTKETYWTKRKKINDKASYEKQY